MLGDGKKCGLFPPLEYASIYTYFILDFLVSKLVI